MKIMCVFEKTNAEGTASFDRKENCVQIFGMPYMYMINKLIPFSLLRVSRIHLVFEIILKKYRRLN